MENLSQLKRLSLPHKMSKDNKDDKDDKGDEGDEDEEEKVCNKPLSAQETRPPPQHPPGSPCSKSLEVVGCHCKYILVFMLGINMIMNTIITTMLSTCFHCDMVIMNTISPTLQKNFYHQHHHQHHHHHHLANLARHLMVTLLPFLTTTRPSAGSLTT